MFFVEATSPVRDLAPDQAFQWCIMLCFTDILLQPLDFSVSGTMLNCWHSGF